jgi:hypothetical protein
MNSEPMQSLRIGSKIKDNDPRMLNRILIITGFHNDKDFKPRLSAYDATHALAGRARIRLDRIYLDQKPRRTGWSLIS